MTFEILLTLAIIGLAIILFITEKLSVDTVSILVMVLLMATGILSPEEGFAGFSNTATITVGAMFVISASIFNTGILRGLGKAFLMMMRKSLTLGMTTIMLFAGGLSAFINDTAVVALLMPTVIQVAKKSSISSSKILIPLSFGALAGGVCTLLGTSTNILVSGIAVRQGLSPIGMFEMAPAGIVFLLVSLIYMVTVGRKLLPDRHADESLSEIYSVGDYFTEVVLQENSKFVGRKISESPLLREMEIEIIELERGPHLRMNAHPHLVLEAGDILLVKCNMEKLKLIKEVVGMQLKSESKHLRDGFSIASSKLYEVMISPGSTLHGKSLKAAKFRTIYGINVLAMRHREAILKANLTDVVLQSGDVLLVSAAKEEIEQLKQNANLLVISESDNTRFRYRKVVPTISIMAGVIFSAAFNILPIAVSAAIGCLLLIIFQCISIEEAYKAVDWKVIFMLAGVLSMGAALEKTGAADYLGEILISTIGGYGPRLMVSAFFFITFMMTNFMSNNATAALLAPIAIITATRLQVDPRAFLMAVCYAASFSFLTPIGYQTNTMVYGPGNYKFIDYFKVGTPLTIIFWVIASFLIPYFFPF